MHNATNVMRCAWQRTINALLSPHVFMTCFRAPTEKVSTYIHELEMKIKNNKNKNNNGQQHCFLRRMAHPPYSMRVFAQYRGLSVLSVVPYNNNNSTLAQTRMLCAPSRSLEVTVWHIHCFPVLSHLSVYQKERKTRFVQLLFSENPTDQCALGLEIN
jgi:hypothetical protein